MDIFIINLILTVVFFKCLHILSFLRYEDDTYLEYFLTDACSAPILARVLFFR